MLTVFQGETGGYVEFETNVATAVSGYLDVISPGRNVFRFDGEIVSGFLLVSKSGLGALPSAEGYTCLPQAVDIDNRVYFLEPADLAVIGVPSFFHNAVLTSGSSLLVRLSRLETLFSGQYPTVDKTYVHQQQIPEALILVTHELEKYPVIFIFDTAGDQCFGAIEYLDVNRIAVTFSAPFSGTIICS